MKKNTGHYEGEWDEADRGQTSALERIEINKPLQGDMKKEPITEEHSVLREQQVLWPWRKIWQWGREELKKKQGWEGFVA